MGIVGVRYDQRLIHGQVATFWTNLLKVDRIVVLDEDVANNDMMKVTLRMATPQGVRSSIITKETFAANYKAGKYGTQRLFVVLRDFNIVTYLMDEGIEVTELVLGNRPDQGGDARIGRHFCVGKDEAAIIRDLAARGVKVIIKQVPQDPEVNALQAMKSAGI
ncbi:MAG: PTS sugar transporter subunit IIB [Lachnospiraceae bacterium]|nr:PTS sugar transporter subunit IIB [Lachnospiraceae bacterium]